VIVPVIVEWNRQCHPRDPDAGTVTVTCSVVPGAMSVVTLSSSSVKLWVVESSFVTVRVTSPAGSVSASGENAKSLIVIVVPFDAALELVLAAVALSAALELLELLHAVSSAIVSTTAAPIHRDPFMVLSPSAREPRPRPISRPR
jgi:hypothetical protein